MNTFDLVASCASKARYSDEQFAKDVALQCWRERHVWLRAYQCTDCGGWHLTRRDAAPVMKPGWRLPKPSKQARARAGQRRRTRRFRD